MKFSTFSISVAGKKSPTRRPENQDRVLCRTLDVVGDQGMLLVVADGMSSSPYGGSLAKWVVETHLAKDAIAFVEGHNPADDLQSYLKQLHAQFLKEFSGEGMEDFLASGASLSVALLHHDAADCLWAGDSPMYVSRRTAAGYDTEKVTLPDHDPFGCLTNCFGAGTAFDIRHKRMDLSPGDIITVASDGPRIDEQVLSSIYQDYSFSKAALEHMVNISARGHFWDDLSIVSGQAVPRF
ncbi:MAG: protein phosphatase 2C domain-containing protein [bacterium]